MKTKSLLTIALKITGIIIILPAIITTPQILYMSSTIITDENSTIPWSLVISAVLYLLVIYYMIFKTEALVDKIYKEKEDEQEINITINKKNGVYFSIIIAALFGLVTNVPSFLANLILGIRDNNDGIFALFDQRKDAEYFIAQGLQIVIFFLAITNASRITARILLLNKKQSAPKNSDNE